MKTSHGVILSLTALVAAIIAAKGPPQWPSVLPRCSMDDPQFEKCLKKVTSQVLTRMAKGMPMLGIRPLDPLSNASFTMVTGNGPISLTVHTNNVAISGPSKVQMKKVGYDKKSSIFWVEGLHKHVKMAGNYHMKGNILVFPIDSTGTFVFEIWEGFANHSLKVGTTTKDANHGKIGFTMNTIKVQKINVKDTTLGTEGSNAVNALVNENWDAISGALWGPMERVIRELYGAALKPLTKKFTAKDFFPPTLTGRMATEEEFHNEENDEPVSYSYSIHY
ncbi:hypothetical protein GE061_016095 [Apolygus lucorum]|uniref:Uncharacterized protein n=1 Tax=Apolygus lucorum TaxID=248454 RepID=A0A6A4JR57_APOLU|nr:hypothetical protein GE061_016095 [Apolygus lucorum]